MRQYNDTVQSNRPRIKNASPFYKNQQAKRFGIDGARKLTSYREQEADRIANKEMKPASEIIQDQYTNYRDNQRNSQNLHIKAQMASNVMQEEQEVQELKKQEPVRASKFEKQSAYLRSLQFKGIKNRFLTLKGSGQVKKQAQFAYYAVPAFIMTAVAFSNFLSISFGVYLKYQALVDGHYMNRIG